MGTRLKKNLIIYVSILAFFGLAIAVTIEHGRRLHRSGPTASPAAAQAQAASDVGPSVSLLRNLKDNFQDPLARLFVQLILIVLIARAFGALAGHARQPAVIGEMAAGILLGPSLLGWLAPGVFQLLFPPGSLGTLRLLSQIGVCLFMFVVGMELDVKHLKQQAGTAFLVSQVSILFPYLLGVIASLFLFDSMAAPGATFIAFGLFIGISMSITAFPVLARILDERGLTKTPLGATAIACAATDDVTAWCVLAFVVAIVKSGSLAGSLLTILFVLAFIALMIFGLKPRLPGWIERTSNRGVLDKGAMAVVLVFIFGSALATDLIGIHALFGAFLAGVVMPPKGEVREFLKVRIEHFSSVFLLPLFFAFTGLRTQIGLLNEATGWFVCFGLIAIATLGKLGGALLAARLTGASWANAFALGALMNTRGLIELVALNLGYDLGILSPRIFTMLVLMALVTTAMTGPLLSLVELRYFGITGGGDEAGTAGGTPKSEHANKGSSVRTVKAS